MDIEHPKLLAAAVVIALPILLPLGRMLFGHRDQFVKEIGLTSGLGRLELLTEALSLLALGRPLRYAMVKLLALLLCWAAFVAAAYFLLVFASHWWSQ